MNYLPTTFSKDISHLIEIPELDFVNSFFDLLFEYFCLSHKLKIWLSEWGYGEEYKLTHKSIRDTIH